MTNSTSQDSLLRRALSWYDWSDAQKARIAAAEGDFEDCCWSIYYWSYEMISEHEWTPKSIRQSAEINDKAEKIITKLEAEYQNRTAE